MSRMGESGGWRAKPLPSRRSSIISVLDVGSNKICCLIARLKPRENMEVLKGRTHSIEVLGFGLQRARGVKSGVITDLDQAEQSIRLAVDAAERMAGVTVESLIVSVTAGHLSSDTFSASISLDGYEVEEADIQRVLDAGQAHSAHDEAMVIHSLPIGFSLDANRDVHDPRGMLGERLGVDMHIVSADTAPLRNLELCINRCHLQIEGFVAAPYASGLSTLVDDEAELGTICVDIGCGTTTTAVYVYGQFVHVDTIAIGGGHVTMDIARGLSTRLDDAERLKTLHGSALFSSADEREMIPISSVSDDDGDIPTQIPRATLTRIIQPRAEEIIELVRDRLNAAGFASLSSKRVVLTGGGALLTGLPEVARRIFARNVRIGRPLGVSGLPDIARGAAFSASVGLLVYPQIVKIETRMSRRAAIGRASADGYFARVGQWIRESF